MTTTSRIPMRTNRLRNPAAAAIVTTIIVSGLLLSLQPELRLAVPMLIGATAAMAIALAFGLYCGDRWSFAWSPAIILVVALLLRGLFLFSPPQLSDDIYRYLWDGSSLLRGANPYAAAPSTVKPAQNMTIIHSRINHPDYVTIYPPAAQILFAGGAAFGGTITGLKTFLVLIDIGFCGLLIMLLKQLGLPVWRATLYAWNPLPVLEIAGSGHVDGAGMTLLMGAFCLLVIERKNVPGAVPRRWPFLLSGLLVTCAGLVKLFPFVLVPLLFLLVPARRRKDFAVGCITALVLLVVPFLPHLANMITSLETYARDWEFAGFAFSTLRTFSGSGTTARLILSSVFLLAVTGITFHTAVGINRAESPITKARQALKACYAIAMALLLLTPTLQPWYALSLAAFLPFCAGPAGLVLCWAVFLTYQVQIPYFILGQWIENPFVTTAVFLAPVSAYLMSRFFKEGRQWGRYTDISLRVGRAPSHRDL